MIHGMENERDISGKKIAQACRMTTNSIEVTQNMVWNVLFFAIFYQFGKDAIHIRDFNKGYCDPSFRIWSARK